MLRNRCYTGVVTFRGAQYEGRHDGVISPALFERVQEILTLKALDCTFIDASGLVGTKRCGAVSKPGDGVAWGQAAGSGDDEDHCPE